MSKILVMCFGGTISSVSKDNQVILDKAPSQDFFRKFNTNDTFIIKSKLMYSSENATIKTYKEALLSTIKEAQDNEVDSVLILHGTDTMAFFAQLAIRLLSFLRIPIVITGSKFPPNDPRSDAIRNVKYAINLLKAASEGQTGNRTIGVVYSNQGLIDSDTVFIKGDLIMSPDSEGNFYSYPVDTSFTRASKEAAINFLEDKREIRPLIIKASPSFPYEAINLDNVDLIIVEAYHSGTADSIGLPKLIEEATSRNIKCFLASMPYIGGEYESTKKLRGDGIILLNKMPLEGAFAECIINPNM